MPCFTGINNEKCEECYISNTLNYLNCFKKCNYNYEKCIPIYIDSTNIETETIPHEIEAALSKEFNIDVEKDKIYLFTFYYINNNTNYATSDYIYELFLDNGTELNISKLEGNYYIDINVPLIDLESSNFNYSKYFAQQGYDIYDKNSNFYNDICSPAYINNNDLTLKDRKADIYPSNVTICKENCHYDGINREEQMIKCKCNLKENYNDQSNIDNFMEKEDFISYFLDKVNYKIFKCHKLLKNFDNLKKNYAFYVILCITFIIIILNIIIYRNEISKLKKMVSSGKILSKTH